MPVRIITADERMAASAQRTTMLVAGPYSVGKTSLLYTLDPATTLALDFEAGMKSVATWRGDSIPIRTWQDACDVACYIGGPNPALDKRDFFSQAHFDHAASLYSKNIDLAKYKTIVFDSLSDLSAVKAANAKGDNYVISPKTKEVVLDSRGMYGDIGRDVLALIRHMQHCAGKNIIWVCKLHRVIDEFKREIWELQIEGQKIGRELPGIVDQVVTMHFFDWNAAAGGWVFVPDVQTKDTHRVFVCQRANPWGLPAKERTQGNVELIEQAHLGKLIDKINAPALAQGAKA